MAMTKIYIVRHCEAEGNIKRIFQGHTDGAVSENGRMQLAALANRFKDTDFSAIYTSPLTRAILTAQAINHNGLELKISDELKEIRGGDWEGREFKSFPADFPNESHMWNIEPHLFIAPNGESMKSVYNRMFSFFKKVEEFNKGQTIAIVSHGCAIRNLICAVKGYSHDRLNDIKWSDNTAVTKVIIDGGNRTVIYENDNLHLGELSTIEKQNWWKKQNRDNLIFE